MKIIHTVVVVVLCYLCMATVRSYAEDESRVRFAAGQGFWPVVFREGKDIKGIAPEAAAVVFDSFEVVVDTSLVPNARKVYELINQRADATTVFTYGELVIGDYPEVITICPESLYTVTAYAIWHVDQNIDKETIYDLNKYRVGMFNLGREVFFASGLRTDSQFLFHSIDAMLKSLLSRRVDVIVLDWQHAKLVASRLDAADKIIKGQAVSKVETHLALSKAWLNDQHFADQFCSRVTELKRQSAFQKIIDFYLLSDLKK